MRVQFVLRFCSQPARLLCKDSVIHSLERKQHSFGNHSASISGVDSSQRGASTLVLVLFVVAILVTAVVGLVFGHKLGYQRGLHLMETEAKQAVIDSTKATQALEDLRLSNKIATNQAATAKQELAISLANLKDLRDSQQELAIENKQVSQLNELYSDVIRKKGGMPLQVLGAKISPLPENAFEYGFDIGMLSRDGQAKLLTPVLTLLNNDDFVEVPIDPTYHMIEGIVRIRGRFVMPSGFRALQAKLTLQAGGQQVEQLYDWKLSDNVDNMLPSLLDLPEIDESPIVP